MIYFECYSDQAFLQSLGLSAKQLDHSFSKGNVCNKLEKNSNSIGFADEDPKEFQPKFIRELIQSKRMVYEDLYLILFDIPKTENKLVLIRPNIEAWSIRIAQELKIDLTSSQYRLSNNEEELHEMLGFARNKRKLTALKNFFTNSTNHSSILKIKEFIK